MTLYLYGRYVWMQVSNPTLYYGAYEYDQDGAVLWADVEEMPVMARPDIRNGKLYVPLAAMIEALGGYIHWDRDTQTAKISTPPLADAAMREVRRDGEPDNPAAVHLFRWLTTLEVLEKYEGDDPFILLCADGTADGGAVSEVYRAANDLRMRVYGLDTHYYGTAVLPFIAEGDGPRLYVIGGFGRVDTLDEIQYRRVTEMMLDYFSS
jgi:hypothetical protein